MALAREKGTTEREKNSLHRRKSGKVQVQGGSQSALGRAAELWVGHECRQEPFIGLTLRAFFFLLHKWRGKQGEGCAWYVVWEWCGDDGLMN